MGGRYFEDEDGFGGEKNQEETIYGIIDTDLNVVEPFRPINDIDARLKEIREERREQLAKSTSIFSRLCSGRRRSRFISSMICFAVPDSLAISVDCDSSV